MNEVATNVIFGRFIEIDNDFHQSFTFRMKAARVFQRELIGIMTLSFSQELLHKIIFRFEASPFLSSQIL